MSEPPTRKHTEVMRALLPLSGRSVVEIGCGGGALLRFMAHLGASPAIGIDPNPDVLRRADTVDRQGDERYLVALGEALPFGDASVDAVVCANTLHHIPSEAMVPALADAARVVKPGGQIYVTEPIAEGAYFELVRPIEDETEIRRIAYEALRTAAALPQLTLAQEFVYLAPIHVADFAAFRQRMIDVDRSRRDKVLGLEAELRAGFEETAVARDGVFWFDQPTRLVLLTRH
ncbi:MAG: class I SAM-dependent methyltransferase [Rhodospirillaceae bacterium]|nr:class I SAM-dependent methyltransferase [Rhodospirillaceae bacterium]